MRLHSIYLENFIGIYNGMGLNKLSIDFTKCTHRILVIKSDNGCGKTSFMRTITPLSDSSIDFIPGMPARKVISYLLDDGSLLTIDYYYAVDNSGDRKPARCSISRLYPGQAEPTDLNPSRNMGSGKEIINDILGIDDSFSLLSSISATQKGLGSLTPSQRKAFIKSSLSSLDFYIGVYKMLTKKHSVLKSLLNNVTTKLSQIGNVQVLSDLLNKQQTEMNMLTNRKNTLADDIANIRAEMISLTKGTDLLQRYNEAVVEQKRIEQDFKKLPNKKDIEYSEERLLFLEKEKSAMEAKLSVYNDALEDMMAEEKRLRDKKQKAEIELKSLGNEEIVAEIKKKLKYINDKIVIYSESFEDIGFSAYKDITPREYELAISSLERINNSILNIADKYSEADRKLAIEYLNKTYDAGEDDAKLIGVIQNKMDGIKNILDEQNKLAIATSDYSKIPKDCNHMNDCPFISTLVANQKKRMSEEELNRLRDSLDSLSQDMEKTKQEIYKRNETFGCISEVRYLVNFIQSIYEVISKFPNTRLLSSTKNIIYHIEQVVPIDINLQKFKEYSNYITILDGLEQDKQIYLDKLESIKRSSSTAEKLKEKIKDLYNQIDKLSRKKNKKLDEIADCKNNIISIDDALQAINYAKATKLRYDKIVDEMNANDRLVNQLDADYKRYTVLTDDYNKKKQELNNLNLRDIPDVSNRIEQSKYRLVMYDQYKKDLTEYQDIYTKEEMIRKYAGVNGIQTVYMSVFMNSILQNTNNLLHLLFNGMFRLEPFEINETEFNIPCIDIDGNRRRDISLMSDSQLSMISMIISFVIFHEASAGYNIIKLDEVDDNLDNTNRFQFSVLLNQLMDLLHYDQALVISHNDEIDLTNADMILFKVSNPAYLATLKESGANIIFSYQ